MKDGMKSSEFWLNIAVLAAAVINGTQHVSIPWDTFLALAGLSGVYTAGRSYVKGKTS